MYKVEISPFSLKKKSVLFFALAGVAQWTECWLAKGKADGSNTSQGTCLGCRPGPKLGTCKRHLIDVSLTH